MTVYRYTSRTEPWTGPGSFWAESPQVARAFRDGARTQLVRTQVRGGGMAFRSDDELASWLTSLGIPNAEDLVLDAAWLEPGVFARIQHAGVSWICRPIDVNVSGELEWIYVGAEPLAATAT